MLIKKVTASLNPQNLIADDSKSPELDRDQEIKEPDNDSEAKSKSTN